MLTVEHSQIWVGDGDSRVWVLDVTTGKPVRFRRVQPIRSPPLGQAATLIIEPMSSVTIQLTTS